jgi:hypothetical protein
VLLMTSGIGVLNGLLGDVKRPSGCNDKIYVFPSVSMAAILPLSGLDQIIFLYADYVGNSKILCPVFEFITRVLESLADVNIMLGSVKDHEAESIPL